MTVVGRGLVFQPVLVTQTRTYNSKNITLTLQIFHPKKEKKKKKKRKKEKKKKEKIKKNIAILPPPPQPHNNNKRGRNTSECFGMSLKLGKLQVKKMTKVTIK